MLDLYRWIGGGLRQSGYKSKSRVSKRCTIPVECLRIEACMISVSRISVQFSLAFFSPICS